MVFWHKSPEAGVERVVAVISHHEVIVLLKSVAVYQLTVDIEFTILNGHIIVAFVEVDGGLVQRNSFWCDVDGHAFVRNHQRTVKVGIPGKEIRIVREYGRAGFASGGHLHFCTFHYRKFEHLFYCALGRMNECALAIHLCFAEVILLQEAL